MHTYIYIYIHWYQWQREKNPYLDLEPISRENSMYSMISRLMMLRTAPRGDPDEFSQNRLPLNQLKRPDYW